LAEEGGGAIVSVVAVDKDGAASPFATSVLLSVGAATPGAFSAVCLMAEVL
jgi:hypothetical protein